MHGRNLWLKHNLPKLIQVFLWVIFTFIRDVLLEQQLDFVSIFRSGSVPGSISSPRAAGSLLATAAPGWLCGCPQRGGSQLLVFPPTNFLFSNIISISWGSGRCERARTGVTVVDEGSWYLGMFAIYWRHRYKYVYICLFIFDSSWSTVTSFTISWSLAIDVMITPGLGVLPLWVDLCTKNRQTCTGHTGPYST